MDSTKDQADGFTEHSEEFEAFLDDLAREQDEARHIEQEFIAESWES